MQTREHLRTARDFLTASNKTFAAGDRPQGSKMLWNAVSYALTAIAQQRNLPYGGHRELKQAARMLADQTGDTAIFAGFAAAEKFQANASYDFMEDFELNADRPTVNEFVERLLVLAA